MQRASFFLMYNCERPIDEDSVLALLECYTLGETRLLEIAHCCRVVRSTETTNMDRHSGGSSLRYKY